MAADHEEDDWAPLTPEQLTLRPGEEPAASEAPVPVAPMPAPKPESKPDPRAERMLRELQDRIANAPKSDSIVASVDRREQRERRKQATRRKTGEVMAATCVQGELPKEPEPELQVDEKKSDCDPRELEDWFRELPEPEQQRLRESWSSERHKFDHFGADARKRLLRASCYGAAMFLANSLLMILLLGTFHHIPAFVIAGAIAGPLAHLAGGQRFSYMAAGALGFLAVMGSQLLANPFLMYGMLFAIATMAAVGMDREMRRSAGSRDD